MKCWLMILAISEFSRAFEVDDVGTVAPTAAYDVERMGFCLRIMGRGQKAASLHSSIVDGTMVVRAERR